MLCLLFAAAVPAQAGTIEFAQVAGALGGGRHARPASELRLRVASQSGKTAPAGQSANAPGTTESSNTEQPSDVETVTADVTVVGLAPGETLTQSGGQIETVDLGDVTGTVCDCGELPAVLSKGGIPWWPLLFTPPLVCLTGICTDNEEECVVNCGPPPCVVNCGGETPVPEPATLLLLGTGLLAVGASARRRLGHRTHDDTTATAGEV